MFTKFIAHLFPKVVLKRNLKYCYTFGLGGMALTALMLLVATGMLLLVYYIPSPDEAYNSVLFIEEHVKGGALIRSIHRMSSHVLLVFVFLHTLRTIFTGVFLARKYNWAIGMFLLLFVICSGYTGYLLPMDQLSYWATQTGIELIGTLPVGGYIKSLLAPDGIGGKLTLIRFYALHVVILPIMLLTFTTVHFYRIRKDKGVLPYHE